jgi:plastocyanin
MRNAARKAAFCGVLLLAGVISAPAGQAASVVIDNLDFAPATVTVRIGDHVSWINKDIVDHTATARGGAFDVATPKGKRVSWRASKVGEFEYYCRLHPNMTGVIRVTQ